MNHRPIFIPKISTSWHLGNPNRIFNYLATDDPTFWRPTDDPIILSERAKTYTYKFNSHSFRCDEFIEQSDLPILFLGCSNTFGIGLELENTWPYVLLNEIKNYTGKKIPLWNLAIPGSSIDEQALVLEYYVDQLKPKIILLWRS